MTWQRHAMTRPYMPVNQRIKKQEKQGLKEFVGVLELVIIHSFIYNYEQDILDLVLL